MGATLILLSPEGGGLALGVMHILAVGFEVLALAVFVRGLRQPAGSVAHGAGAGLLLAAAALTTPRSYLFIAAFLTSCLLLPPQTIASAEVRCGSARRPRRHLRGRC